MTNTITLRRVAPGSYDSTDGLWSVFRTESGRWVWTSRDRAKAGGDDLFLTKAEAVLALQDAASNADMYPDVQRYLRNRT